MPSDTDYRVMAGQYDHPSVLKQIREEQEESARKCKAQRAAARKCKEQEDRCIAKNDDLEKLQR